MYSFKSYVGDGKKRTQKKKKKVENLRNWLNNDDHDFYGPTSTNNHSNVWKTCISDLTIFYS